MRRVDILDRLLGHDYATTRELLLQARRLNDDQLDQVFDVDHGSVRATFAHMIGNVAIWSDLIDERPVDRKSLDPSIVGLLRAHERTYGEFADLAREIRDRDRLDELFTDTLDTPATEKRFGGAIVHVITHNMHHRAQVIWMMNKLGVRGVTEGDALSWETSHEAIGVHGEDDIFE
ncbi:MAG TPA: DinB family protein [Thermomicrobiales bacterium]|nr:DinB family protein [Thermomicrobiales bacterium]HQZ90165.1 DinB family protein [Thermomicrobiales bacterium]HRA30690.1 DinB family protein [Thermomicrobiales bacterium]